METTLVASLLAVALVGAVLIVRYGRKRRRSPLEKTLDDRLAESMGPGTGSHLERAPTVRWLAVVEEHDRKPVLAPVVRVDLGTTDAPGMRIVLEYVADVLESVHPALRERDERVARYDLEFTFGPDGLLVEGECRRVTVPAERADELLENDRYGAFELWRDVKRGDRDAETVTTLWGECRP